MCYYRVCLSFSLLVFLAGMARGQSESDLYLFSLHKSSDGLYHLASPKFLSSFNTGGYTNQPCFTKSGDLLVSIRKKGEDQNDIVLMSPSLKKYKRITDTKASEYSPRPGPDGVSYTVVRQVPGDSMDQQVFRIPVKGGGYTSLTPDIRDVGYYTWITDEELGMFRIEGEQSRLATYSVADHKSKRIMSSIGRTLVSDGKGSMYYVHKFSDTYWYIKKYNPASSIIDIIVETPGKTEDFTMASDGTFFMGRDAKLYSYHPDRQPGWKEVADLSIYGISRISRLALSMDGNQLAVVSERK